MQVKHSNGIAWVDRESDQRFRYALINGCPRTIQPKIKDALSRVPKPNAREHSHEFFGDELPQIVERTTPLVLELEAVLEARFALRGFMDWLNATGYGNDVRMIKAFDDWASYVKSKAH